MANGKELDHAYRMRRLQMFSGMWRHFMTFCCVGVICACFYLSVRTLAGKSTTADLVFKAIANLKANRFVALIVSWALTCGASGWAISERRLRKRHVRRISSEASEMQAQIDPNRRSSHLSKRGETASEDI